MLTPMLSYPSARPLGISRREERLQELAWDAGKIQLKMESIQGWISQLPRGFNRARELAQDAIVRKERDLEIVTEKRPDVAEALEKLKSEEGGGCSA